MLEVLQKHQQRWAGFLCNTIQELELGLKKDSLCIRKCRTPELDPLIWGPAYWLRRTYADYSWLALLLKTWLNCRYGWVPVTLPRMEAQTLCGSAGMEI